VVVVINNETKAASASFDVSGIGLGDGMRLQDRLDSNKQIVVERGKLNVSLAGRTAAIFTR
jgi:hypothetical protein